MRHADGGCAVSGWVQTAGGAAWVEGDLVFHPEHGKGTVIEICFANSRGRRRPATAPPRQRALPCWFRANRISAWSACSVRHAPNADSFAGGMPVRAARPTVCE